jgi:hypothetical protein
MLSQESIFPGCQICFVAERAEAEFPGRLLPSDRLPGLMRSLTPTWWNFGVTR